ncbi:uncharacterized protein LOC129720868 [Wyeomyia smithii]|uniref:uncharacterized protein LOC129720868 n=1 Tax=Wyeomyia smithii TaxID=174621 RepID=UPI002467BD72|nr:uncharacterized protein LOC129720868 [Wyeomyia smithii]
MKLSDALSSKLLNPTNKSVFTEVPGFVGSDQLEKFSTAGYKSDYVFIKLLMLEVWPDGLSGRSVTGRMSNNPLGRGLHTSLASSQQDRFSIKTALEPEKVEYIAGRLYEHRLNMGDSPAVARINAEECNRLMSRVISYHGKQVTSGHH